MLKKITDTLIIPINAIAVVVMVCMVVLTTAQIFFRYVLSVSVPWTEEVARLFFIWMIFIGTILVEADGAQVRTMVVVENLPRPVQIAWEGIIAFFSIVFQIVLFVGSVNSWDAVSNVTLGSLTWVSYRVLYVPVIIGSPICVLYMILHFFRRVHELYPGKEVRA